jgi:hypothetical protein
MSIDTMNLCSVFTDFYKPTYILGNDTRAVSRITKPDSIINKFLFDCIINKDFRAVKYAFVIIYKQNREYWCRYKSDYIINDGEYNDNGIVAIVLAFIKYYEPYGDNETVFFTTDICKWMQKHKNKIPDYKYIKKNIARYK